MKTRFTSRFWVLSVFLGLIYLALPARASHLVGGELTFHADTTDTSSLRYFFKLVLYQDFARTNADNPTVTINFGDGTTGQVSRSTRTMLPASNDIYRSVYYFQHDYPSSGTFTIYFKELNRSIGFANIPNSENTPIFIQAAVTLGLQAAGNHSPIFLAPPITSGVVGQPFRHNITAYDPDGDSLAYKLVPSLQNVNQPIPSYQFPAGITMNNRTGEIVWSQTDKVGRYVLAAEIREYRQGQLIGKVMRDFEVIILPNGVTPVVQFQNKDQIPVNARNQLFITSTNKPIKFRVAATQAGALEAYSELFRYSNIISAQIAADNPLEKEYTLNPSAILRRSRPYIITFRGTASNAVEPSLGRYGQQDLTLAIYFRPERAIDQTDTTEPGEKDILTGSPQPDDAEAFAFNIYPNPVRTYFKVDNNSKLPAKLLLYNAKSQLVLVQAIHSTQTNIKRLGELRAGIYYYIILTNQEKIARTGKLLVL